MSPPKKRLKVLLEVEYDVVPEHYPDNSTPKEMFELDIRQDPAAILETEWKVIYAELMMLGDLTPIWFAQGIEKEKG